MTIEHLSFDSELFKYAVGKAHVTPDWEEKSFLKEAENFQLVYLFSPKEIQHSSSLIRPFGETLLFTKEVKGERLEPPHIHELKHAPGERELALALKSGLYSRFSLDQRLENSEFERLYRLWLEKEYERGTIFISGGGTGLISLSEKAHQAEIGLLAVDESKRGTGVGTALLSAAENRLLSRGIAGLQVKTQRANRPAVRFYEKNGFREVSSRYIYHYYRGD
ncbi:GNAT family N-acetyltransferase [Algoriphagus namhaensis]